MRILLSVLGRVQFGAKEVLNALDPLVTKCKWNDWQCVANAIRRIAQEK